MAVIQYYLNGRAYADFVDRAERLGMSEHQLAKHLALTSEVDDSTIMSSYREAQKTKGGRKRVSKIGQA